MQYSSQSKNIQKRGRYYYLRVMIDGKRYFRSLGTGDRNLAKCRARDLIKAMRGKRFDILEETKANKNYATIDQIITIYEHAARMRGLSDKTIYDNIRSFHQVLGLQTGSKASSQVITRDAVERFLNTEINSSGNSTRRRRSLASTLRQAKSIFARWVISDYERIKLPDIEGFMRSGRIRTEAIKYILPPEKLRSDTLNEGRKLRELAPHLYQVFLLTYDLGLRAGEAVNAKWSWIRTDSDGRYYMDIIRRPDFKPKGRERSVPVSKPVWDHLHENRQDHSFILPGKTTTARTVLVKREFAEWMRGIGWEPDTYPKAAHELRKLIGSRWYTELGAEVAQSWLGHVDISTTCRYYATLTRQPHPLDMDGI